VVVIAPFVLSAVAGSAFGQVTTLVSVDSAGNYGNKASNYPSLSPDGRYVAFESFATNLAAHDGNHTWDAFVRDRLTGTTKCASLDTIGLPGNGPSNEVAISSDGRFVAFASYATNLVHNDRNGKVDIFVRDFVAGTTERVTVNSAGVEANDGSGFPSISADGRFVVFESWATNLVMGDKNGRPDVFLHDRVTGANELVSISSTGAQGDAASVLDWSWPTISADGRYVAFWSYADNLVSGDGNGLEDVFVHDRQSGTTEKVSVDSAGYPSDGQSFSVSISPDGRFVGFVSYADNLVPGDTNNVSDAFVHDRQTGATERVNVDSAGVQGNGRCSSPPVLSADGRYVVFDSDSSNLVPNDTNGLSDVFRRDRQSGTTERMSVASGGQQGDNFSYAPWISADGRFVAFQSTADNLVPGDSNWTYDDFLRGPDLTLEADPPAPTAGATITFSTWTGQPSGVALLVVIDVNGAPMFVPGEFGTFDGAGLWTLSRTVPTGLSGSVFTLQTIGFVTATNVDVSNAFAVSFQ
jgi:Tol biopolymer transport system component